MTWDKMQEECGIFGVYSHQKIDTYSMMEFGMFALQHRGQEASGVTVLKEGKLNTFKKDGLVLDMFKNIESIDDFQGNAAIGHTRYSTTGDKRTLNFQPLYAVDYIGDPFIAMAHNGNFVNDKKIRAKLSSNGVNFLATSDSEVYLRLIQKYYLKKGIEYAVRKTATKLKGAYSILMLTKNEFVAVRDPFGIRPLCYGVTPNGTYVFSSETCGLDAVGAQLKRELEPGEMIILNKDGFKSIKYTEEVSNRICAFEYIYFARPDSTIQSTNVYDVRYQSGQKIYDQSPVDADVVIGVPDSGIPSAIGYSDASGIPYKPLLIKNRYMSRSFIVPTQSMRERIVNLKLNPIYKQIQGKKIVILDDSIVRGTTSKRLVKILRKAGAKEIHFRSASPPIIAPCFLGIDTPRKKDLISAQLSKDELRNQLEVDSLDFLSIENLYKILGSKNYCTGCFNEKYPIEPETVTQTTHLIA